MAEPAKPDDAKKAADKAAADAKKAADDAKKAAKEEADRAIAAANKTAADVIAKAQAAIPEGYRPFPVKAIATGYYGGQIRVYGDKFLIENDEAFATWMEPIDESDRKRLAKLVEANAKTRKTPAPPNVRPTPAVKLV